MDMKVTGQGHWHIVPIVGVQASMHGAFLTEACPADAKQVKP